MKKIISLLTLVLLLVGFTTRIYAFEYPKNVGFVNDFANIINQETEQRIENKLSEFEKQTGNEVAVVTVKNLNGESIEEYSINLAEKWGIGKKDKDNGVLFLTSLEDRKNRIEVGYGNEEKLTDIETGRILRSLTPFYKNQEYDKAIETGVDEILKQLDPSSTVSATLSENTETDFSLSPLILLVVFIIIILILASSPYTPIGGQGTWGITSVYKPVSGGSFFSTGGSSSGSSFGGFGGGSFGGGGSSSSW